MAKGSNLTGLLDALETLHGKTAVEQVIAGVPTDLATAVREGRILVGGWYPLEWYKLLHKLAQEVTGKDQQLARELAHLFVTHQLNGIYKPLLKVLSPHWLFNFPTLLFSRYFSVGKLDVPESRAGYAVCRWSGCRGFDRNIWLATFGGSQAAVECAGAKQVTVEIRAGATDNDETAEIVGRWV
jgi:hypothetical protein